MRIRHLGYMAALSLLFFLQPEMAAAKCQLQWLGFLPVEMHGLSPIVSAKINGAAAQFIVDTGAPYSTMWGDAAVHYQLPITQLQGGNLYVTGAGGTARAADIATVKYFDFLDTVWPNAQFVVVNQGVSDNPAGLIGQNLLSMSDVEFDFANAIIRYFKPVGCDQHPLAYWVISTPYSFVKLEDPHTTGLHIATSALVNGRPMTVWFDTGAPRSYLSLDAAARIGITPIKPGVTFLGVTEAIGPEAVKTWSVPVESFQLGKEKVEHVRLLMSDFGPAEHRPGQLPDMLLGEDFFLSHRIYVAYSQHKLYFTYNGGPSFNLDLPQVLSGQERPPATPASNLPATTEAEMNESPPTDADSFRRRGMAYASNGEFDRAFADLTRAIELAPGVAENHYELGVIHDDAKQFKSALQDFDDAIKLQSGNIDARLARARLLMAHPDTDPGATTADIEADLDAVSRTAAPDANVRLTLGSLYDSIGKYPAALGEIDEWLDRHPLKNDQAAGLTDRCRLRATANRDVHEALDDCNRALDQERTTGTLITTAVDSTDRLRTLDIRGLLQLRLGNPEAAVSDYASALGIDPNLPSSLYGRGLAELRLGEKSKGQADLAAAEMLDSGMARYFSQLGLAP